MRIALVVDRVTCNLCGGSCAVKISTDGTTNQCAVNVDTAGCYGQDMPPDGVRWRLDLCQLCFGWIVSLLRIQPESDSEIWLGAEDNGTISPNTKLAHSLREAWIQSTPLTRAIDADRMRLAEPKGPTR